MPAAQADIPTISMHQNEKNTTTASSFRLSLTAGANASPEGPAGPRLRVNFLIRDTVESPKSRLHLDWMTEAGLENEAIMAGQFHVRAGVFPNRAPPKSPPPGSTECRWAIDAGTSGATRTLLTTNPSRDRVEGPTRITPELGLLSLCRTDESRYSVYFGGRAYRADRESASAPSHLDRLIGEVFAIAEWSDPRQRRVSGSVSLDVAPLEPLSELRPRDFGGTFQLGIQASHPAFQNDDRWARIHVGLEGKYLSVPEQSDSSNFARSHSWQAGAVVSVGY